MDNPSAIKMAMDIRNMIFYIASVMCLLGLFIMIYRDKFAQPEKLIRTLVLLIVVVGMMSIYPKAVLGTASLINYTSHGVSKQVNDGLDKWSRSRVEGDDSTFNFKAQFISGMYSMSFGVSKIVRSFLVFVQKMALYVLIALSPLLLSLLMIKETSDIGVKFLMVTLATVLWSIGFNLSDMMIYSGWDAIMHLAIHSPGEFTALGGGAIASGLVSAAGIGTSLPVLTIGLALMIAFYFLVGILVFNIMGIIIIFTLLMGGNPISSALGAVTAASTLANGGINAGKSVLGGAGKGLKSALGKITGGQGLSDMAQGLSFDKAPTHTSPLMGKK
jgi:hypothetical protein